MANIPFLQCRGEYIAYIVQKNLYEGFLLYFPDNNTAVIKQCGGGISAYKNTVYLTLLVHLSSKQPKGWPSKNVTENSLIFKYLSPQCSDFQNSCPYPP